MNHKILPPAVKTVKIASGGSKSLKFLPLAVEIVKMCAFDG
jgi:hypothetical protein